jgi:hypothetical protein
MKLLIMRPTAATKLSRDKRSGRKEEFLAKIHACSDCCCRLTLSNPFDEDLRPACDDHEHSHRDQTLLACDEFRRRIILDGQVLVGEIEFPAQMSNGESARAQHLRDGFVRVKGPIDRCTNCRDSLEPV